VGHTTVPPTTIFALLRKLSSAEANGSSHSTPSPNSVLPLSATSHRRCLAASWV